MMMYTLIINDNVYIITNDIFQTRFFSSPWRRVRRSEVAESGDMGLFARCERGFVKAGFSHPFWRQNLGQLIIA